jgi:hypothetical protein
VLSPERVKWKVERRLLQEGLTPNELAFATATLDFSPGGQLTTAAMQKIADKAGMGRSTAFKVRNALVERGIITTEPQYGEDGAQTTSLHTISRAVLERAGVFFSSPPSMSETGARPRSGHKRDPLSSLDRALSSGSVDRSENGKENQRARTRANPTPVFVSSDDDPVFVEFASIFAAAHEDHYRPALEAKGETYDPRDAGTIRRGNRADVVLFLRNLVGQAHAIALAKGRHDLTPETIRPDLFRRIALAYLAQDRRWLIDHCHAFGGIWGEGGKDDNPCDLHDLSVRVLEEWGAALDPGWDLPTRPRDEHQGDDAAPERTEDEPGQAPEPPEEEPPPLDCPETEEEAEEARRACAEFRAALKRAQPDASGAALSRPARLPEPPRPIPPRGQRLTADLLLALARIDAEDRAAAAAKALARRDHADEDLEHDAYDPGRDLDAETFELDELAPETGPADLAPTAQEGAQEPADDAEPPAIDVGPAPRPKRAPKGRLRLGTRPLERLAIVAAFASRGAEEARAIEPEDVDAGDDAPPRAVQLGRRRGPHFEPRRKRRRGP